MSNETFSDSDCFVTTVGEVVGVEFFKGVVVEVGKLVAGVVVEVVELVAEVVVEVVELVAEIVVDDVELVEVVDVVTLPGHSGQSLNA